MKRRILNHLAGALVCAFASASVHAATTDLASAPLVTSAASSVLPNIMFMLDDSGSMNWNYLPDWATTSNSTLHQNNKYNGVAYSASVVYSPPVYYNADGSLNTTTYPQMTAANTANFTSVPNDGYGVQSSSSSNLVGNANFYTFVAGEYCDKPNLRNCVVQSAPTISYPYPATLRWCSSSTLASSTCQAVRIETGSPTFMNARYPTNPPTLSQSAFTISGSSSTSVAGITVNGQQIMNAAAAATTSSSTLASSIVNAVNACTLAISGNCTVAGYSASLSSSSVTLKGPAGTAITYLPAVTKTGSMSVSPPAFSGGLPGFNLLTSIVSTNNSYPFPGTTAKATTRSDCAGTTCTYTEEMTNYANWWAYYHTRMQMMKTGSSLAFQNVGANYRVGYVTIDDNTGSDFINPAAFNPTNKLAWYNKFFSARPNNGTPLRATLSLIGRLYAGQLNGTSWNGVVVTDPMQYSCQQNFVINATDGYWNEASGFYQLDGSTNVGNQDGSEPRPYNDGGGSIVTTITPSVTTVTNKTVTPVSIALPWTQTTTTIGAACSTGSGVTPTSCVMDNGNNSYGSPRTWCMVSSSNPRNSADCTSSIGAGNAWACRGTGNSSNLPKTGTACGTDSSGQNWCVYNNNTAGTSCSVAYPGDNIYICKPSTGVTGSLVTTATQTYTEAQTGSTSTTDAYATTVNTQVVTTNGVPAPPTTSTSGPVVTNISPLSTTVATDTGAPTGTSAWSTPSSSTVCTAPPLPAAGSSPPAAGTAVVTPTGTATVTTLSTVGPVVGTPTSTSVSTGGTSNTLADVAEYYYKTDLRTPALGNCTGAAIPPSSTGLDVCANDVPTSGLDAASWQHMTDFALALGASGYMQFSPTYATDTSGDYFDVANGTAANPASGICSWQSGGACNWPVPVGNTQTTIDDLWHSAVDGRGTYFSATNPATLTAGLSNALSGVSARTGSSAAATTSNPNVTSGDNFVFSSTFTTQVWDGELVRQQLDLTTGAVSPTADWSAQSYFSSQRTASSTWWQSRKVYMAGPTTTYPLPLFNWADLSLAQQAYFMTPNINPLTQFCSSGAECLSAASQTAAAGATLVNFLDGDSSNEGIATDTTKYFRLRTSVLGDIVNAEAAYVRLPLYGYADSGYSAFVAAQAAIPRQGEVYVASNDGMLHAFNASNGDEDWAYVPSMVMPNLYKLADKNYASQHQYFVDGTPVTGDIAYCSTAPTTPCSSPVWKTMLVAGLNGGGRGYYALDVTNPTQPTLLWEFTDVNMGYTYGNPVITKLQSGEWVVLVTSGYNNVSPGDGVGRLYVLDASTGALVRTISTGVGSITTPSGLGRISAWVDNTTADNTALRAYGGDMLGNLWRFDINGNVGAAGYDAQLLVTFYADTAGTVTQPITTKPELGLIGSTAVVFVGTGRFLGATDLADTTQQTFYAVKDTLGTTTYTNPQASGSNFIQQIETTTTCPTGSPPTICSLGQTVRTSTANAVNFAVNNGWYVNLPDGVGATGGTGSERDNTDPTLALGTLGFTTNVPNSDACTSGGYSYRYVLDYRTGAPVSTSTTGVSAIKLGNALATRGVFVRLPNNTVVQLTRLSDGTTMTTNVPIGSGAGPTRRISWRELIQDQ